MSQRFGELDSKVGMLDIKLNALDSKVGMLDVNMSIKLNALATAVDNGEKSFKHLELKLDPIFLFHRWVWSLGAMFIYIGGQANVIMKFIEKLISLWRLIAKGA
jgi:hypothetical protein